LKINLLLIATLVTIFAVGVANAIPNYSRTFNGSSDNIAVTDNPKTSLSTFTVSVWFKTSKIYTPAKNGGEGMMVTKGGWISNTKGEQLNYGIWISDANHLRGGFETFDGKDNILTTTGTKFNDGKWHNGVITYDKTKLKLYVDGLLFKELVTTATPEKNSKPLNIGKNPLSYRAGYFKGDLDDAYVWSVALTANEVASLYSSNTLSQNSKIIYSNSFGGSGGSSNTIQSLSAYNFSPSLGLDGGKTQNGATIK
jgi:hypothetical protein